MMKKCLTYKGYDGTIEYNENDRILYGSVMGINDLISYEGESVAEITKDFEEAIDEYFDYCNEVGKTPEKPFKGQFNIRIETEVHRDIANIAYAEKRKINDVVKEALKEYVAEYNKPNIK